MKTENIKKENIKKENIPFVAPRKAEKTKSSKAETEQNPYGICYDHYLDTNACTECTGLAYRPADDRDEWNSYHDVFDFTPSSVPEDDMDQDE